MTDMQTHPLRTSDSTEEVTLAHTGLKSNAEQRVSKIAWAGQGQQSPPSADGSALAPENGLAAKSDDDKSKPRGERLMAGLVRGMHNLGNAVHDVGHSVKEQTRAMGDLLKLSKQVSEDLKNTTLYPELEHDAHLRRNNNLSKEEEAFVTARKAYIAKSGILKRFLQLPEDEEVHEDESLWHGECFVFDGRVSVGHGLVEGPHEMCHACRRPILPEDKARPEYEEGVSCHQCIDDYDDARRERFRERQRQIALSKARGEKHLGPR